MQFRLAFTAALSVALIACGRWSQDNIAETKARGEVIIRAVEAYRNKHGKYPIYLTELEPGFLRDIPQPAVHPHRSGYTVINNKWSLAVGDPDVGPYLMRVSGTDWMYSSDLTSQ